MVAGLLGESNGDWNTSDRATIIKLVEDRYLKISLAYQNKNTYFKLDSTLSLAL